MWKRSWVMILHCPQTWPPSWGAQLKSKMMLPVPLPPSPWNPHGHLLMKAPSAVPPWFHRLCPQDFLPHTNFSSTRDFQTARQGKILALAHALQACAERLGVPTGVLCDVVWKLQRCMAPLMSLSGDDIVEASLLEPAGEEHRTSPTLEEEAFLLGQELELLEAPKAASLPECPEIPKPAETS